MSTRNKFVLLNPIQPSYFGLDDDQVQDMIDDLSSYDIHVMLVEGQRELLFYVWSYNKEILEELCSQYCLKGILLESQAVYDPVDMLELA